jgi:hypothetical protein
MLMLTWQRLRHLVFAASVTPVLVACGGDGGSGTGADQGNPGASSNGPGAGAGGPGNPSPAAGLRAEYFQQYIDRVIERVEPTVDVSLRELHAHVRRSWVRPRKL